MYGILCLKDGDPKLTVPIKDSEDDSCMATWDTLEEAQAFAKDHIMCQISLVLYVDLENYKID